MNRREDPYSGGSRPWDVPSSVSFPSQSRAFHSRPTPFTATHPFHEEHHEDGFPIDNSGRASAISFPSSYRRDANGTGALLDEAVSHSLERDRILTPAHFGRTTPVASGTIDSRSSALRPSTMLRDETDGWQQQQQHHQQLLHNQQQQAPPPAVVVPAHAAAAAQSQFNSPAHNFGQHLRERSPSSSSALLNLLNRYPSARQSIYLTTPRVYQTEERPTSTVSYRGTQNTNSNFPLVELAVPKSTHRTSSLTTNEHPIDPYLSNSFHEFSSPSYNSPSRSSQFTDSSYEAHSPQFRSSFEHSPINRDTFHERPLFNNRPIHYSETRTTVSSLGEPTLRKVETTVDYGNGPLRYYEEENGHHQPIQQHNQSSNNLYRTPQESFFAPTVGNKFVDPPQPPVRDGYYRDPLDISTLDSFVEDILGEEDMSRSTNQWRNSFAQMQERFKGGNTSDNTHQSSNGHVNNGGSMTLPRGKSNTSLLTKSNSHTDMRNESLLGAALDRRSAEAPEFRKSPQLASYWENTLKSSSSGNTLPRQPATLTASERLQLLHEDVDHGPPKTPQRKGSGEALAARRLQYQQEVERKVDTSTPVSVPIRIHTNGGPNFSSLEEAVHELQSGIRRTGYSEGARRTGGCARFPTESFALSPPRARTKIHSPSPDTISESSSIYQMPSGLPHPKPKHNIKEQLYYAGLHQNTLPRSGLRTSPNFPVPSMGSVTSRITEFEKRPGTPTLSVTTTPEPVSPGPMSPRSTVFRSKPVIHIEMGNSGRSTPIPSAFEFSGNNTAKANSQWDVYNSPTQPAYTPNTGLKDSPSFNLESPPIKTPGSPRSQYKKALQLDDSPNSSILSSDKSVSSNDSSKMANVTTSKDLSHSLMNSSIYEPADNRSPAVRRREQPRQRPVYVPPFHFPQGKPVAAIENDSALRRALEVFKRLPGQKASFADMEQILKACGLPTYWKRPVYDSMAGKKEIDISGTDFTTFWRKMTSVAHDEAARFIYIVTGGKKDYIEKEDLAPLCYDVIWSHPGLVFYHSATEFHATYVEIVTARIFWTVNRSWSGKIHANELRKSDLLEQIRFLENEDDINKETRYFSYEHFYVVYCKFWELDQDHDMMISKEDLLAHEDGALTPMIVDRIFSKAVCRGVPLEDRKIELIGLSQFTAFLLADEDKKSPTSIEYWFRICDIDGDGVLSLFELETLYSDLLRKLESFGIESMAFQDIVCNLLDMIRPKNTNGFTLRDLRNCPLAFRFFNSFVNWKKFYAQEVNEGEKPSVRNDQGRELSDWERYCAEEYESLMEGEGEQVDESHSVNLDDEDSRNSFRDLL